MTLGDLNDVRDLIEALPFGVAVYDEQRRLQFANTAIPTMLGFPPGAFRRGSRMIEHARVLAYRGLYGPGDPEKQAHEITAVEIRGHQLVSRRQPDGRTFAFHYMPIEPGAMMVCVIDTSNFVAARDEAERLVARVHAALSGMRIGLAVFAPNRTLVLLNRCFTELLGIPPNAIPVGSPLAKVLQELQDRNDFAGRDGELFLAAQGALDRSRPSSFRRERASGQTIDVQSDPLPDGGFTLAIADISPLARAEAEANRRAALLDSILRQVPHGICVYGPDRRVTMVNAAYATIMAGAAIQVGERHQDIVARRAEAGEYGSGDWAEHVRQQLGHDVSMPQSRRRRRPDGRTIDIRTAPLPDGGHICVIADVSTLVDAQEEIANKAELLAGIVNHIPHGVTVYGPDRTLQLVNAAYGNIMGGAAIALGETIEAITERRARTGEYGPGNPADLIEQQRAHDSRKPQYRRRHRPNGNVIDVRTAPLPDGGHISVVTDVTTLVAAEAELERRAETMDAMLANIRHGIVLWDSDRKILAANAVVDELLIAPPGLFVPGRKLEETVTSALERGNLGEGAAAEARAKWLLEEDRSKSHEDRRLTRNGRVLEVRSDPTPQGGFVTTYTDVTRMRQAEDALRLAKSAAEAANAAKSRFLAAMSTELRSPINTILNEFAIVSRDAAGVRARQRGDLPLQGLDPVRVQQSADAGIEAARHLLGLIDEILDVARLEAGRFDLADDVVLIPTLVRQCLRQFDSAAAAAEVVLVVDLPDNVPTLRCDARRMRQALGHLVSNAVSHTSVGSVSISAQQEWTSGDLVLRVQDTGVGISAADLDRVFEPFAQGETAGGPRHRSGAGLGLYISRILLRAHGGELTLRSTYGQGTTAELRLPASRVLQQDGRSTT